MSWLAEAIRKLFRPSSWDQENPPSQITFRGKSDLKILPRESRNSKQEQLDRALARHPQLIVSKSKKVPASDSPSARPVLTLIQAGTSEQTARSTEQILTTALTLIEALSKRIAEVDALIRRAQQIETAAQRHMHESVDIRLNEVDEAMLLRNNYHTLETAVFATLEESRKTAQLLLTASTQKSSNRNTVVAVHKRLRLYIKILTNHEEVLQQFEERLNADLRAIHR